MYCPCIVQAHAPLTDTLKWKILCYCKIYHLSIMLVKLRVKIIEKLIFLFMKLILALDIVPNPNTPLLYRKIRGFMCWIFEQYKFLLELHNVSIMSVFYVHILSSSFNSLAYFWFKFQWHTFDFITICVFPYLCFFKIHV